MSAEPLVSVIIPTYNRAGVICKSIDDVFRQTYKNIELIVIDDGSTDDTQATLRRYGSRIRWFTQANSGPSAARNRGLEVSRGDIIAFQDSDDLWEPTKLERQVRIMEKFGDVVPCCLCNMQMKNFYGDGKDHSSFDISLIRPPDKEGLWFNVAEVLATRFVMFNQAAAIRRRPLENLGGFDTSLQYLEDYDLSIRLAIEGPWAYIKDPLAIWAGGGADSLAKKAYDDAVVLNDCMLRILVRALASAQERGDTKVERHIRRSIEFCRRSLRRVQIAQSGSSFERTVAQLGGQFDRYYKAILRRSPWFPQVRAITFEEYAVDSECIAPRNHVQ
jgi:glycosyltransferase involved in cell wall biosynthesis